MYRLFGKIRYQILSKNRFLLYSVYAIGEILLVVLGILIALSIDNWNEERKLQEEIKDYLVLMRENLKNDSTFYSQKSDFIDFRIDYLMAISEGDYEKVELDSFLIIIQYELDKMNISPSYISLTELGIINKIQNDELIQKIRNYYEVLCKEYNDYADWHSNFVSENVEKFFVENLPVSRNRETDNKGVIKELEKGRLLNIVNYQISNYKLYQNYMQPNMATVTELIQMIDKEIK